MNRRDFILSGLASVASVGFTTNLLKENHIKIKKPVPVRLPVSFVQETPPDEIIKIEKIVEVIKHPHKRVFPDHTTHEPIDVKLSSFDKNVLVRTIWGETRGETAEGQTAVVHVILNRKYKKNPLFKKYKTISQLCLKKYQFSCWLEKWKMNHIKVDDKYKEIEKTVLEAVNLYEKGIDKSNEALFYYSDIMDKPPSWTKVYNKVKKIGSHNFYTV